MRLRVDELRLIMMRARRGMRDARMEVVLDQGSPRRGNSSKGGDSDKPSLCEFLQCTVLGKHGAVSDDVTLRGRDVIFFLKQAKIISRCRYVPGMPRPCVSK